MTKAWKEHRDVITRLYILESRTLDEVRDIMQKDYDFKASTRSYRQQFDKWQLGKYNCKKRNSRRQNQQAYGPQTGTGFSDEDDANSPHSVSSVGQDPDQGYYVPLSPYSHHLAAPVPAPAHAQTTSSSSLSRGYQWGDQQQDRWSSVVPPHMGQSPSDIDALLIQQHPPPIIAPQPVHPSQAYSPAVLQHNGQYHHHHHQQQQQQQQRGRMGSAPDPRYGSFHAALQCEYQTTAPQPYRRQSG